MKVEKTWATKHKIACFLAAAKIARHFINPPIVRVRTNTESLPVSAQKPGYRTVAKQPR